MPKVTLVVANGPGFPSGSPDRRYEIEVALTPGGHLDVQARQDASSPWPARRIWPGAPSQEGDILYDTDTESWAIRLGAAGESPPQAMISHAGQLRPGEYVTIREPDGVEYSYRVVGIT
ncbi:hypothetical protein [Paracraurococcus ruber]|uniref:Uncharacterized protein n=1 Tax=Paracraurococcus ruber TaxID=77675 RepID=A0ABS1D0M5_9PROT|nr:hypothetical protein [Paracraurococcus ruber]MBK1660353.1 hypothetical protein [Paracraurococcus ruber]TDG27772.1 hypothetical protein E2C05_21940 [Paracraurococcus ruber]